MYRKVKQKIAKSIVNLESPAIKRKHLVFDAPKCFQETVEHLSKPDLKAFSVKQIPMPKNALVKITFPQVALDEKFDEFFIPRQKTNVVFFDFRRTKTTPFKFDTPHELKIVFEANIVKKDDDLFIRTNQNRKEEFEQLTTGSDSFEFEYLPKISSSTYKFKFPKYKIQNIKLEKAASISTLEIKSKLEGTSAKEIKFRSGPAEVIDVFYKNTALDENEKPDESSKISFASDFNLPFEYIDSIEYHLPKPVITNHLEKLLPDIFEVNLTDATTFSFSQAESAGSIENLTTDNSNLFLFESTAQIIDYIADYSEPDPNCIPSENLLNPEHGEMPGMPEIFDLMKDVQEEIHSMPKPTDIFENYSDEFPTTVEVFDILSEFKDELDSLPGPVEILPDLGIEYFSKPEFVFELTDITEPIFDQPKLFIVKIKYLDSAAKTYQVNNIKMSGVLETKHELEIITIPDVDSKDAQIFGKGVNESIVPNMKINVKSGGHENILDNLTQVLSQPSVDLSHDEKLLLFSGLFNFQIAGVDFLSQNKRALLADELGLGKTLQTVSAVNLMIRQYQIHKILILCPKEDIGSKLLYDEINYKSGWYGEFRNRSEFLKISTITGNKRERINEWHEEAQVVIAESESLVEDYSHKNFPKDKLSSFDCLIIDECGEILANDKLAGIIHASDAEYIWALSSSLNDELVPKLNKILKPKSKEANEFKLLQRKKENVVDDLPSIVQKDYWIDFGGAQKTEYDKALSDGKKQLEDFLAVGNILRFQANVFFLLHQLKQYSNFSEKDNLSSKTKTLLSQVKSISESKKQVLVFSNYDKHGTTQLEEFFSKNGIKFLKFVSGMSADEIKKVTSKFKNDQSITVLLSNIKSGGARNELPKVPYIIHFDQQWNPSSQWQIDDIVAGYGNEKVKAVGSLNVYNYMPLTQIEIDIMRKLQEKGLLFRDLVDSVPTQKFNSFFRDEDWMSILKIKNPFAKNMTAKEKADVNNDPLTKLLQLPEQKVHAKISTLFTMLGYKILPKDEEEEENRLVSEGKVLTCNYMKINAKLKANIHLVSSERIRTAAVKEFIHYTISKKSISRIFVVSTVELPKPIKEIKNEKLVFVDPERLAHYLTVFNLL